MRVLPTLSTSSTAAGSLTFLLLLLDLITPAATVKHENFKTCSQSGFCRRNRAFADSVISSGDKWVSPYEIRQETVLLQNGKLTAEVLKTVEGQGEKVVLPLEITFHESGAVRVTIDELRRKKGDIVLRGGSKARKERYNEAERWALVPGWDVRDEKVVYDNKKGEITLTFGPASSYKAVITAHPFSIKFLRDGETHIVLNDRGLMNLEHWRAQPPAPEEGKEKSPDDLDGGWEETFGGNTDSKPRGPEAVALDITFPGYEHVYGIPSHATSLSLKTTRGGDGAYTEPYRLYNADVFEYIVDSPMTLYGSIPFMQAHRKGSSVGVLWLNAAETWVDVVKGKANKILPGGKTDTKTHWISESGLLDVWVFLGPDPRSLYATYGQLTGYTKMPPSFAIAYHQCRWNYVSVEDVIDVDKKFDKNDIPYDVIWLDIEYTDGKRYFTFDPLSFKDPFTMMKHQEKRDRKVVLIIDPHIKNTENYPIVEELKSKDLAVKDKDGNIYEGWCWPGSSHWVDCFNPAAIEWWKSLFAFDKFKGTMKNTYIWNDMNEPSVFNGPETTMPKDNLHFGNWEHRDLHNINGMTFMNATHQALEARESVKGTTRRSFVLTRAFFAGAQRLGAMWTGDNEAKWEHLQAAFPMLLSQGIAGFPFSGADVGGFFGNPSKELLTRWYQSGIWYPFFRAHAHIDAKRREPYLTGEPYTSIIREAVRLRYALLPAWYTAFHRASIDGMPILRPNFVVHPDDEEGFHLDDQAYIGDTGLLVKPVVHESGPEASSVNIHLPDSELYYDYWTYKIYRGKGRHNYPAPLEKIPVLMRGGHIIPRRDRHRRSSGLMKHDPFTLVVVLGVEGNAVGHLYVDDGETFDYKKGYFIHRKFTFSAVTRSLTSTNLHPDPASAAKYWKEEKSLHIEKIIIVGASVLTNSAATTFGKGGVKAKIFEAGKERSADLVYSRDEKQEDTVGDVLVVKNPKVRLVNDWTVSIDWEEKKRGKDEL
ncbi:Alpha-glucosidase [Dactylella cylindrospora]|nr:Alpha-glucosidase [Dactylella cylindrospora]